MATKLLFCGLLTFVMVQLIVSNAGAQETANCAPNTCSIVRCRGITEEECPSPENYIDPKGGYCGCCPKCVKISG